MKLTKENLDKIKSLPDLTIPKKELLELPERVLEFGTGVLLRGLPNHFIDKANQQGIFNGRIVVVKSTDRGSTDAFAEQDGLYTVCVRGLEDGQTVDKKIINSSISRVVSAASQWNQILECASNKDLQVIISNTTEAGVKLVKEDKITDNPPSSFPGKLLAFLLERYKKFNGSLESGLVILPTELIPDNGKVLKNICLELATINNCDSGFVNWISEANDFCSTLVDRIVPGALPKEDQAKMEEYVGYEDQLTIMAEPYSLWAIETSNPRTKEILSFAKCDPSVAISDNINKHREIKIRLLNAPHTFTCAFAISCGFPLVKEAMEDEAFLGFISELMHEEIIPTIVGDSISQEDAEVFAGKVLDRFANPFIAHEWLSISAQYTSKVAMRCVPILLNHYKLNEFPPYHLTIGFAAYILFMQSKTNEKGQFIGTLNGKEYVIVDDKASVLHAHWSKGEASNVVKSILSDVSLWNTDLTLLPEFEAEVLHTVLSLQKAALLSNEV